jgi:putative SOS response-associated peptidase YedK
MCGRFTLRTPATVLIEQFDLDVGADQQLALFEPRSNIAPTQDIVVVRPDAAGARRAASMMRWGLVPPWSKEISSGAPMINARSESLAEKPEFRNAFRRRRCLIPADGFYEWRKPEGGAKGKKQAFWINRPDGRPFAFAGLWEVWRGAPVRKTASQTELFPALTPNTSERCELVVESCTIVTTGANAALCELHDRMPVILAPGDYALWLDPNVEEPGKLQHLLAACHDDELVAEPVSSPTGV